LNAILYVQNAADLSATLENEFTGGAVASPDHFVDIVYHLSRLL
jgi:hypothetical protein